MDERVPLPPLEDAEGPPEEPAGADDLLEPEPAGEAGAPDQDAEQPRHRPAPELSIEEQRRRLQEETGEREGPSRKHRPLGDYKHFG
jgi:hypothetical protein